MDRFFSFTSFQENLLGGQCFSLAKNRRMLNLDPAIQRSVQEADTFFTYGGYTQIDASLGGLSPFKV